MDDTHIINFQHLQCSLSNQLKNLKGAIFQMKFFKQIRLQYKLIQTKRFNKEILQRNAAKLHRSLRIRHCNLRTNHSQGFKLWTRREQKAQIQRRDVNKTQRKRLQARKLQITRLDTRDRVASQEANTTSRAEPRSDNMLPITSTGRFSIAVL
ncbi:hypothetical protein CR513_49692, partial [Mucuna pruriens]